MGRRSRRAQGAAWVAGALAALGLAGYVAVRTSPWPGALLLRIPFNRQARQQSAALAPHVPAGVGAQPRQRYDAAGRDTYLDVFYPAELDRTGARLPAVVWVHGGAWISGNRKLVGNYLRVLAGHGFTTVAVGYTVAPGATYPTPVRQVNTALGYLQRHAQRLHVDPDRLVLAGDSAGAQIVAQLANVISVGSYADRVGVAPAISRDQLAGTVLHCGAYDLALVDTEGEFRRVLAILLWAYTGRKDFAHDPGLAAASVAQHVTAAYPPAFISAGNADPLVEQSRWLATALTAQGVEVDTLIFGDDYPEPLPHEYQFDLDAAAGRLALQRTVDCLHRWTDRP